MDKVILLGAGGHCKVVVDILQDRYDIVGVTDIDITKHGKKFYGVKVLGNDDVLVEIYNKGIKNALLTLGSVRDNTAREKLFNYAKNIGFNMVNAISNQCILSKSVMLGEGNVILPGVIINACTRIGSNCIINTGSIIEHDCIIEDHVHISPGVKIAGGVKIGKGSFIGIGCTIIQGVKIGNNVTIGAGAVVIEDIPDNAIAVGVPAKIIKYKDDENEKRY